MRSTRVRIYAATITTALTTLHRYDIRRGTCTRLGIYRWLEKSHMSRYLHNKHLPLFLTYRNARLEATELSASSLKRDRR